MNEAVKMVKLLESDLPKFILRGFLSSATTYALHVSGPVHVREIDNLIRILQLNREWLKEDEEATPEDKASDFVCK